jgi:C-terminal processing protease CtpA/Prc
LVCGDLLTGVGVLADPSRAEVELSHDGASRKLQFALGAGNLAEMFGTFPLPPRAGAHWLEGHDKSWRLEVMEPEHALYVQFNEVAAQGSDGQSLADFAAEIVRNFDEHKLSRVIVDVRANGGGDNTTFGPLIHALQTPALDRAGVLFGLIGRYTFSAAGNFVTVLERDTNAILLGEPTGGAPNQYGDAQTVPLPNHPAVLVRISTRFHQFGKPDDPRLTHEPRLRVPLRSGDYFAGRDPVLRAALDFQPPK